MTRGRVDRRGRDLLLGEWACLGVLYQGATHGFAIAVEMRPEGDIGRVWSLSRALTYRSLDQLVERGLVSEVGEEPGIAGGNRTVLAATRRGRAELRRWLAIPVEHLRDLRSELLLKLMIAQRCGIDVTGMLDAQRVIVADLAQAITVDLDDCVADTATAVVDPVGLWRRESATAALRFLDRLPTPFV